MKRLLSALRKKPYRFKGWDWTELGEYWGILDEKEESDKINAQLIREYMGERMMGLDKKDTKRVANDIKKFLRTLCKRPNYSVPVWKGMLEIKDNETLIQWTMFILESMWS